MRRLNFLFLPNHNGFAKGLLRVLLKRLLNVRGGAHHIDGADQVAQVINDLRVLLVHLHRLS